MEFDHDNQVEVEEDVMIVSSDRGKLPMDMSSPLSFTSSRSTPTSSPYPSTRPYDLSTDAINFGGCSGGNGIGSGSELVTGAGVGAGASNICIVKEHMFDKVVTPSDVGKLNRLVIPKQHAEKYFPLDSTANEKGLLLSFEDRSGKLWRFRYSYWNSSQSYVMTKGWSRFVKEKKLYAGDIVSFQRGAAAQCDNGRLFIDWKRRPAVPLQHSHGPRIHQFHQLPRPDQWGRYFLPSTPQQDPIHWQPSNYDFHFHRSAQHLQKQQYQNQYGAGYDNNNSGYGYNVVNSEQGMNNIFYLRSSVPNQQFGLAQNGGLSQGGDVPMVIDSVPVVKGKAVAKRLRLFGVNMECPISDDTECDQVLPSTIIPDSAMGVGSPLQLRLFNSSSSLPLPTYNPSPSARNLSSSRSLDLDI